MKVELHGISVSNNYNIAKAVLLEKNIEFEEVPVRPSQEEDFLKKTPLGKIPFLKIGEDQFLYESWAIAEYLEDAYPDPRLLPSDPAQASSCRSITLLINLYIEPHVGKLLGAAVFGRPVEDMVVKQVQEDVEKGVAGLKRAVKLNPFIAGEEFSLADCNAFFHFSFISMVCNKMMGKDFLASIEGMENYMETIKKRPAFVQCLTDQQEAHAKLAG